MEPSVPEEIFARPPVIWQRVRATWLSQRPAPRAGPIAALCTLALTLGSIAYQQNFARSQQWMAATHDKIFQSHELWRLWTTLFAHADAGHLISNSLLFFILGYFLNGYFGAWLFPWAAFAFGGITNILVLLSLPPETALIGVSGVVYWMGGAWLSLYFAIDKRRTYFQRGLRIIGVALGLFMPATAFDPSISYSAHFVGFLLGLGYGIVYYLAHRRQFEQALVIETVVDE